VLERWSVARAQRYAKRCGLGVLRFLHSRRVAGLPGNDQPFITLYQELKP